MKPIGYEYPICPDCSCKKNAHSRIEHKDGYTCFTCKKCKTPRGTPNLTHITNKQYHNEPEKWNHYLRITK